ncbi:hypothetical protein DL96DRAFT_1713780 [Flagelloscypha sp. PMI_526]|nr:hypothetical protein DL96DRAFT_1713780 [Flagelloscypha sp. PMI_526]
MVQLDVIVVGGGIAGLATAFSLQRAGHQVTVLEGHPSARSGKGGIKSPPNMTQILDAWGLGPMVKERGVPCERLVWTEGETGDLIGFVPFYAEFMAEITAGFYFLSHRDVHSSLLEIALQKGVKIRYSSRVSTIDPSAATVILESGERLSADLIVGADGAESQIRASFKEDSVQLDEEHEYKMLGLTVPIDSIGKESVPTFKSEEEWMLFFGSRYFIGVHLFDGKDSLYFHMAEPTSSTPLESPAERWSEIPPQKFQLNNGVTIEPRLKMIISHATTYTSVTHKQRPLLESFTDDYGKCVLVGDAAHPLSPYSTQSTALAMEDAKVLGVLLSYIQRKDQLPHFLSAYEELRMPRCHESQKWDDRKRELFTLPSGERQSQRDQLWRSSSAMSEDAWDALDHEAFWKIWGQEMSQYVYHSREAAEDWWTKWGAVLLRDVEESKGENFRSPTQVRIERVHKNAAD